MHHKKHFPWDDSWDEKSQRPYAWQTKELLKVGCSQWWQSEIRHARALRKTRQPIYHSMDRLMNGFYPSNGDFNKTQSPPHNPLSNHQNPVASVALPPRTLIRISLRLILLRFFRPSSASAEVNLYSIANNPIIPLRERIILSRDRIILPNDRIILPRARMPIE